MPNRYTNRPDPIAQNLAEIKRLYVEERRSLIKLGKIFKVDRGRISTALKKVGVTLRPPGAHEREACKCGKPVYGRGLCRFHYRKSSYDRRRGCERRAQINAMCDRLAEIVRERPYECIGVVADWQVKRRYGSRPTQVETFYFWQGSRDRSPDQVRLLGSVPDRLSLRTSRMLLKALGKARQDAEQVNMKGVAQ